MHHPGFRRVMLEICFFFANELETTDSYIYFFFLMQFERVCFGILYFAATESQELPLSTSLSILYFSLIEFEVIFLL